VKRASRALTIAAVGFLSLDAVLLGYAGLAWNRPGLTAGAVICGAGVALVLLAWRRHRRTLAELEVARREMRQEIDAIRELLHRRHLNN
jgi:hypothetical protein